MGLRHEVDRDKEVLTRVVADLSYKPGWVFAVESFQGIDGQPFLALNIRVDAICVESGAPITIDRSFPYTRLHELQPVPEALVEQWIADCISVVEAHEFKEFLRFRGKPFYDDLKEDHE